MLLDCGSGHPQATAVETLLQSARKRNGSEALYADDMRRACAFLLRAFEAGLVELQVDPPGFARRVPTRPLASRLARSQVAAGETRVVSLRPSLVQLDDPLTCSLVLALDGTRDRDGILAWMRDQLKWPADGTPGNSGSDTLEAGLDASLERVAALGLLCPETSAAPASCGKAGKRTWGEFTGFGPSTRRGARVRSMNPRLTSPESNC
jgi:hypothetical protein